MSIESRSWAWSLEPLRPAVKLTLLAIADVADERGHCYCSQRRLIHKTYQSEGTIKRILRELEQLTLIVRIARFAENGARIPDGFALQLDVTNAALIERIGAIESAPDGEGSKIDPAGEGVKIEPTPRSHSYDSSPESLVDPHNKPDSNLISPLPPSPVQADKPKGLSGGDSGKTELKTEMPKPITRFYGRYSNEGAAIRVIAGLRGETDVPNYWQGQEPLTHRAGYWVPFEITPRLIGLAHAERDGPVRHYNWPKWKLGSQEAGAWRGLLKSIGLKPPEGSCIRAPWPFPPRADGSLSVIEDATGPPVIEPMSENEAREFAGG